MIKGRAERSPFSFGSNTFDESEIIRNNRKLSEILGQISDKIDYISDLYYDISEWRWNIWETTMNT